MNLGRLAQGVPRQPLAWRREDLTWPTPSATNNTDIYASVHEVVESESTLLPDPPHCGNPQNSVPENAWMVAGEKMG